MDCSNKKAVLKYLRRFEVKFVDDKKMEITNIISVYKVRKLLKKRHTPYLDHVVDTQAERKQPRSVPIVREYLDVFLEEMNGLPLMREIKFTIEVVSETTPILKPLSMVLSELRELKSQIKELLEKGYIRPNTLP